FTTGALDISLKTTGKARPYLIAGAGIGSNGNRAPSARLTGNYQFLISGGAPINETDSVTVRSRAGNVFTGVFGGGVKYGVTSRWGVRLDIRDRLNRNSNETLVDARPSLATFSGQGNGFAYIIFQDNVRPSLQFSNLPSTSPIQSTL